MNRNRISRSLNAIEKETEIAKGKADLVEEICATIDEDGEEIRKEAGDNEGITVG